MSADLGADFDNVPLEARKSTCTAPVGGFGHVRVCVLV